MTFIVHGKTIKIDNESYLLNSDDWAEKIGLEQ